MARTILVVDDEPDAQKLLSLILVRAGFQVAAAASGTEALAYVQRSQPDLIILDVMMPSMDGYEVLRRLRANPSTQNIPVIMLSAKGEVRDRVAGLRSGADDYVTKPADATELVARVEAILARVQRTEIVERGRVIAFIGAKGGVGTTTLATNVGAILSRSYQVVLAELRRGLGTAASYLNLQPRYTLADLLSDSKAPSGATLQGSLIAHACGLRLLAAPPAIADPSAGDPTLIEALLGQLVQSAQWVLLDMMPDPLFFQPVLAKAEALVLVTNPDPISLTALQALLAVVEKHNFAGDRCQVVVINRLPGAGLGMKVLAAALQRPVQAVVPYAAESCVASAKAGAPLVIHQPNDLASVVLGELAGRLAGIQSQESGGPHTIARSTTAPAPGEVSKFVFPSIPPRSG